MVRMRKLHGGGESRSSSGIGGGGGDLEIL